MHLLAKCLFCICLLSGFYFYLNVYVRECTAHSLNLNYFAWNIFSTSIIMIIAICPDVNNLKSIVQIDERKTDTRVLSANLLLVLSSDSTSSFPLPWCICILCKWIFLYMELSRYSVSCGGKINAVKSLHLARYESAVKISSKAIKLLSKRLNALRDQWSLCDHIQEIWSCKESVVPLLSMLIPWFCFDAIASTHVREFNICAHTYSSENFLVTSIRCSTVRLRKSEYALLLCDDIFFFFLSCSSFFSLPANKANERANCFISCIHSYASFMWLFI